MLWKVYINTRDYTIKRAVLKDEEKELLTTSSSGEFYVEIEAYSESEARSIALIKVLRERVGYLEKSLATSDARKKSDNEALRKCHSSQLDFMRWLRKGELSIANTGKRILIEQYRPTGIFKNEICSDVTFEALVQGINEAEMVEDY
jgi:hypothetical protein